MIEIAQSLIRNFEFTGDIKKDSISLLDSHGKYIISEHTRRVAAQARKLAEMFGEDGQAAETAGLLHDISGIIPSDSRLEFAEGLGVDILEEERPYPFILHQKLSAALAEEIFDIKDKDILSAIGCHTTLKKNAQGLDLALFTADKLQWDQKGTPPYMEALLKGLQKSLKHAALAFIEYNMDRKSELLMVHPWFEEAYVELQAYTKNV
jgi:predicted HD superfamily hydrolase involved in NAD metabolism